MSFMVETRSPKLCKNSAESTKKRIGFEQFASSSLFFSNSGGSDTAASWGPSFSASPDRVQKLNSLETSLSFADVFHEDLLQFELPQDNAGVIEFQHLNWQIEEPRY